MFEPVADPLVTQSVNAAGVMQPQPVTEWYVYWLLVDSIAAVWYTLFSGRVVAVADVDGQFRK